jgi:transcription elongation factor Elf1
MNLEPFNKQLHPCSQCKSSLVEIIKNENAIGVMCQTCGNFFAFENPRTPLKEVVEWWNNH